LLIGFVLSLSNSFFAYAGDAENWSTPAPDRVTKGMDFSGCRPEWPRVALRYEMQGRVQLQLLVDVNGQVIKAQITKSSGWKVLDDVTVATLEKCTVKPATRDGKPEKIWALTSYLWRLEGPATPAPELIKDSCLPTDRFSVARPDEMDSVIYLHFSVGLDGKPLGVQVNFGSNNAVIDMAATQFASNCRYKPVLVNGVAVQNLVSLRLHWNKSL
jgi:protein TonB